MIFQFIRAILVRVDAIRCGYYWSAWPFSVFGLFFLRLRGVTIQKPLRLIGFPLVEILKGSDIFIDSNVTLNSSTFGYNGFVHSPVSLFASNGASISIGKNTRIHGVALTARKKISIGKNCLIAGNTVIVDSNGHETIPPFGMKRGSTRDIPQGVTIEDDVWIGMNCLILKGVTIGRESVIGAGSIVTKDIPPFSLAVGSPAKVVRELERSDKEA